MSDSNGDAFFLAELEFFRGPIRAVRATSSNKVVAYIVDDTADAEHVLRCLNSGGIIGPYSLERETLPSAADLGSATRYAGFNGHPGGPCIASGALFD